MLMVDPKSYQSDETNPMALIAMATEKGVNVETLEKLMTLQERWEKNMAKKEFDRAMADFQGKCPVIVKEKDGGNTSSGKVAYKYSPLDSIVRQTKELIKDCGFSYMVKSETKPEGVSVTCIVKHERGHSEESTVDVPLGTKTNIMSASQQVAAAITFAKRYAFCNAFGILTGDEDNDGKKMDPQEQETNTDSMFKKAQEMILKEPAELTLLNYQQKISSSQKYTDSQKQILISLINTRLDEIEKSRNEEIPVIETEDQYPPK